MREKWLRKRGNERHRETQIESERERQGKRDIDSKREKGERKQTQRIP